LHDSKDLTAASLAGKGQLENVQEVYPFAIVFRVNTVGGSNLEQHLHLEAEPNGEVGQAEKDPTKSCYRTFGCRGVAIEGDATADVFFENFQRVKRTRFARRKPCAKEYRARHLFDGRCDHLVDLLRDYPVHGHLDVFRHVVDHRRTLFHLSLPRLEFALYSPFVLHSHVYFTTVNLILQSVPVSRFYTFNISFNISRSEEHTSELQSRENLVCRLLLE